MAGDLAFVGSLLVFHLVSCSALLRTPTRRICSPAPPRSVMNWRRLLTQSPRRRGRAASAHQAGVGDDSAAHVRAARDS